MSALLKITLSVIAFHLALVFWSVWEGWKEAPIAKAQTLVVKTVSLKKKPEATQPVSKPEPKKEIAAKTQPPLPSPPSKKSSEKEALIAKAKNTLSQMGKSQPNAKPAPIALSCETVSDASWSQEIIDRIKESLVLPEKGDVTVELSLTPKGGFKKMTVVKAASQKNKKYIEEMLPRVKFPSSKQIKEGSFTITLSHEI